MARSTSGGAVLTLTGVPAGKADRKGSTGASPRDAMPLTMPSSATRTAGPLAARCGTGCAR